MSEFELNSYNNGYSSSGGGGSSTIGDPIITLCNDLASNEIWLEGATVSRTEYSKLFEIYGTTYGSGDGSTTFVLPDFRDRAIWGADSFGYIDAGLPNITGNFKQRGGNASASGAFYVSGTSNVANYDSGSTNSSFYFDASRSSDIYGASDTVQPPAIKVRVKTRYK